MLRRTVLPALLLAMLPGASPAEPAEPVKPVELGAAAPRSAAPVTSPALTGDAQRSLPAGDGDEFRRVMLGWAPAAGAAPSRAGAEQLVRFAAPLDRMRPSSGFGLRVDPIDGRVRHHDGMDIPDQAGAPVRAAAPGLVVHAGPAGGYGTLVVVRHADGLETLYGHLSRALAGAGQEVRQGQIVGLVGETGRATGNHLHFEVRSFGRPVDPDAALADGVRIEPVAPPRAADPPLPVTVHWAGWRGDPDQLPAPAF